MKVVKSGGQKASRVKRIIECNKCGCEFEVQSSDLNGFKLVGDWRDGDYYKIPCPECKTVNNTATSLF